jgi:hypothetical protein
MVTLVPNQKIGWLAIAGGQGWATHAEISCNSFTKKITVHGEDQPNLVLTLECPEEKDQQSKDKREK